jgi:hypothetical protein
MDATRRAFAFGYYSSLHGEASLRELCRRLGEIAAGALTGLFALEYLLLYDVMELMFRGQHVRNPPTRSCTNLFVK